MQSWQKQHDSDAGFSAKLMRLSCIAVLHIHSLGLELERPGSVAAQQMPSVWTYQGIGQHLS